MAKCIKSAIHSLQVNEQVARHQKRITVEEGAEELFAVQRILGSHQWVDPVGLEVAGDSRCGFAWAWPRLLDDDNGLPWDGRCGEELFASFTRSCVAKGSDKIPHRYEALGFEVARAVQGLLLAWGYLLEEVSNFLSFRDDESKALEERDNLEIIRDDRSGLENRQTDSSCNYKYYILFIYTHLHARPMVDNVSLRHDHDVIKEVVYLCKQAHV